MRGIAFEPVADMPADRDDRLAVLQELRKLIEYCEQGIALLPNLTIVPIEPT